MCSCEREKKELTSTNIKQKSIQKNIQNFKVEVEIITLDNRARLLKEINGNVITRIPTGTQLEVLEQKSVSQGGTVKWTVTWYKVNYNGKIGWISEHDCRKIKL